MQYHTSITQDVAIRYSITDGKLSELFRFVIMAENKDTK